MIFAMGKMVSSRWAAEALAQEAWRPGGRVSTLKPVDEAALIGSRAARGIVTAEGIR
jgi:transketolase C-terminal domain/subunit